MSRIKNEILSKQLTAMFIWQCPHLQDCRENPVDKNFVTLLDGIFPSVFRSTSPYLRKWDIFSPWSKMKILQNCVIITYLRTFLAYMT